MPKTSLFYKLLLILSPIIAVLLLLFRVLFNIAAFIFGIYSLLPAGPTLRRKLKESEARIEASPTVTLYHQTSSAAATAILSTQLMLPGRTGLVGGGIYFAKSPVDTYHKAIQKGETLKCQVKLGRSKLVPPSGDRSITRDSLALEDYDSVLVHRPGGDEYVVYDSSQIVSVERRNGLLQFTDSVRHIFRW